MPSGYVIFKNANILHGGVNLFRDELTTEQYYNLYRNGHYLARYVFNTSGPKELNNVRLYFTEKYGFRQTAYLVEVRGCSVLIENLGKEGPEEGSVLPEHLFEL